MTNEKLGLSEEPYLIFQYIKEGNEEAIETLINNNQINVNLVDNLGNDVISRLLKAKMYDYVFILMKKKNWKVNHQNEEGNTFGHLLAQDNSIQAVKVFEELIKKRNYIPNIKNNNNETALDISLNNNYLGCAFKILQDKRFNCISMLSFKQLLKVTLNNKLYGKYSKITNLEIIVENFEKKELDSEIKKYVNFLSENMDQIKNDIMIGKVSLIRQIIK